MRNGTYRFDAIVGGSHVPNPSSPVPKYRKHKASGQAVVTLSGRDHYLGPHGSKVSEQQYDRLVGEWLAAGRQPASRADHPEVTVAGLIVLFWRHLKLTLVKHGKPTGSHLNYRPVLRLLRARYGTTAAVSFGPLALKALRLHLVERGNSRRYINENVHRIRKMFKWAASEQLIPVAIPQALATVEGLRRGVSAAKEGEPVQPVSATIVEATLPFLSQTVADMVRLQRLTGARPGEICALRHAEIDRSGVIWKYTPAEHKTEHHGHRRVIFIGPKGQAVLGRYLLRSADAYCFSPQEAESARRAVRHANRSTPLSCGNLPGQNRRAKPKRAAGKCYTNDSYRRAIQRGCELAFQMPAELRRLPKDAAEEDKAVQRAKAKQWREMHLWSPHQLRHSAATEIRHKYGLEAAQATLGHRRMDVTEIYAEKNQDLAARVASEVG